MIDNKYAGAIFVNDIITNVLKVNITSKDYDELCIGSKRDIFYRAVYRKMKYLSETCSLALKNLILKEIDNDDTKKNTLFDYLKKHLSSDIKKFIEDNPDDVEKILEKSISKFTIANGKTNPPKPKNPAIVEKINELYIKTSKYLNYDTEVAFIFLQNTIMEILKYTVQKHNLKIPVKSKENTENIPQIDDGIINQISYKSIIPDSILCIIDSINSMVLIPNSSESYKYTIETIYYNLSKVIEWLFKDYIKDELQFTTTKNKADNEFFYQKEKDNLKIYSIEELLKLGWTYEDIATAQDKIFKKYIPFRDDNDTSMETMISMIKHTLLSRRVLLDNNNNFIGYWHFYPLFEDTFKRSKDGSTTAEDMSDDKIPHFWGGRFNVEFGAVVLDEHFRNPRTTKKLLYSILECLEYLALNEHSFINEIVTKSSSKNGISFIQSIGLKFHKKNNDGTANIYVGKAVDLLNKQYFRDFQSLKEEYQKEFNDSN